MAELPGQPNLSQLLEAVIEAVGEELHVSMPGVITSVNTDLSKASVQPAVRRHDSDADPVLPDVPLLFPTFGRVRITWPVESGDPCLLIFADRSIEEWESKGGDAEVEPVDPRTHDLTDAMAIPMGIGGASLTRTSDISLALTNTALVGAVELRLQDDGKLALGNSARSGTYKDFQDNDQNFGTPTPVPCELVALLVEFLDMMLSKTEVLIDAGLTTPVFFREAKWNTVAEIRAKLNAIKGSL